MPPPQRRPFRRQKDDLSPEEREAQEISRIKLPRGQEVLGFVETRLGASRMRVRCADGKTRVARIPGRLKRKLWVRPNDIVIVEPWEFGGEEKGDVLFKYTPTQRNYLQSRGHLKKLEEADEF
ncbi:TPA: translation initiation factor eIF-1A [Candidatus Woesearchaeota archaeon]|nr:translation initiation factor eIF-1A [Candidatus Woesearchaeota archaeon]HII69204.1 translation initiation factor eIF-1A [Candidatus Woesearchaeota archaeon]